MYLHDSGRKYPFNPKAPKSISRSSKTSDNHIFKRFHFLSSAKLYIPQMKNCNRSPGNGKYLTLHICMITYLSVNHMKEWMRESENNINKNYLKQNPFAVNL